LTNPAAPAAFSASPISETTRLAGKPSDVRANSAGGVFRALRQIGSVLAKRWQMIESTLTPLGWTVGVACPLGLFSGYLFGWHEFIVVGWITGAAIVIAALYVIGRGVPDVRVDLANHRVMAGDAASATVSAHRRRAQLIGVRVELPIGDDVIVLGLSTLLGRSAVTEVVPIPTKNRGIVVVGPVRTVRTDPLGLFRKESISERVAQLIVHPRTVTLPTTSIGFVRDLEGALTHDLTSSDLAFYSLREYVAGDDRRTIHWRSTAKAGRFMVRQFLQTRRSHVFIGLSLAAADYADEAEFETAVSVAGSLGSSAIRNGRSVSVVVSETDRDLIKRKRHGARELQTFSRNRLLDDLSGIGSSARAPSIVKIAPVALRMTTRASAAFFIFGSTVKASHINTISAAGVGESIAVRCAAEAQRDVRRVGALTVCTINTLDDFRTALVRAGTP